MIVEPLAGRRHETVTERRTIPDFAAQMMYPCDEMYPEAGVIRVVLDNLNTHAFGSLFATYPPEEAWRLARRLPSEEAVVAEVGPWEAERNRAGVRLVWSFRVADARRKLSHLYPQVLLR